MEYLPVEVIAHIFQFLPSLEDRKVASLVCKIWYEAFQSPTFRTDEVVEVTSNDRFNALAELENPNRKYLNVVARRTEITGSSKKFWERYGPFIKSLTFYGCDIREKVFVALIDHCLQLESLCVQDCRELLMSGRLLDEESDKNRLQARLERLKSLNLGYNRYLSDAIFAKFTSVCHNIRELLLPGCYINFHAGLYRKFYSNKGHSVPSESVLTFPVIFDFIRDRAEKIKVLSFSETLIDSDAVTCIAQAGNLALQSLNLRRCQQLTNDGIVRLSDFQTTLTMLDLALCPRITDLSLLIICSRLTKLKSLSVQGCRAITDLGVSDLGRLTNLNHLNISECELIHDEGIIKGLCTRKNPSLRELYLSHLADLTDNSIVQLMDSLPELRVLDLGYCYNAVTDRSVQSIFSKGIKLRTLILTMCERVTDRGLTGIAMKVNPTPPETAQDKLFRIPLGSKAELTILREAKLKQDVQEICENVELTSDLTGSSLSNLKHLQKLNLSGCNRISDVSLKYAIKLSDLRWLDLSGCQQITADGLASVLKSNTSIETLNLDNCQNINDEGVYLIFRHLKRLRVLTLGSSQISDQVVDFLCQEARDLSYLDVRHCAQLSASAITTIMESLPRLQKIHFTDSKSNDIQNLIPPPPPPLFLL